MSQLADFIDANIDPIVQEWVRFAATLSPMSQDTPLETLRDHAQTMLARISADLRQDQSVSKQKAKSEGLTDEAASASAVGRHGSQRQSEGLDLAQMVAEFRALRATVVRLWSAGGVPYGPTAFEEVVRFNECIDQALAESASSFSAQVEHFRQLMSGMVAHDLRGPLHVVSVSTQILIKTHAPLATDVSMIRLRRASSRMHALVDDLMEVAGSQLGSRLRIVRAPMDLQALALEAMDEARAEHPQADFQLECASRLYGDWDRARLAQLLFNLLRNAVEHGDATHPVRCAVERTHEGARIEVQNQGVLIPESQRAAIFEALVSERSGASSGRNLGLGLYICREIVLGHGGTIEVRSSADEGTVFSISLPWRMHRSQVGPKGTA